MLRDKYNSSTQKDNNRLLANLIYLLAFLSVCETTTITVTSGSNMIGALTQYQVKMSGYSTNPTSIIMQFGPWTPTIDKPYLSNYTISLTSGTIYSRTLLSCSLVFITKIRCTIPASLASTSTFHIANIYNPSSAKPYQISFFVNNQNITTTLTVTTTQTSNLIQDGFNDLVSSVTQPILYFSPNYYFSTDSYLEITFPSSSITLNPNTVTNCDVISNSSGVIVLSGWQDSLSTLQTIRSITFTNPAAVIPDITISARLYFIQSSTQYNIQKYSLVLSFSPLSHSQISLTSPLELGKYQQILTLNTVTCPQTPVSRSTSNTSYIQTIFLTTELMGSVCSSESVSNGVKTCNFRIAANPKQITNITVPINSNTQVSISIITYTYFSALSSYYPLCSTTSTITLQPTSITNIALIGSCSEDTGGTNQMQLQFQIDGWQSGDAVYIEGLLGGSPEEWTTVSTNKYVYYLTAANTSPSNSSFVIIPLTYTNPTFAIPNSIEKLTVYRRTLTPAVLYASNSDFSVCSVTSPTSLGSLTLSKSSSLTWATNAGYTFTFNPTFSDYVANDYLVLSFINFQNLIFLNSQTFASSFSVKLNSRNKNFIILNSTAIKIILTNPSSELSYQSSNTLILTNMMNPAAVSPIKSASDFTILFSLYTKQFEAIKQNRLIITTFTQSSLSQVSQSESIPILSSAQGLMVTLSNPVRGSAYYSNVVTTTTIRLPFSCRLGNSSSSSDIFTLSWTTGTNSEIYLSFENCDIGYLNLTTAIISITETIDSIYTPVVKVAATSTSYQLKLMCPENCLECSSSTQCTQCVGQSVAEYNYLYSGQCYNGCPTRTYIIQNTFNCQQCHESCQTCTGISETQCLTCRQYFSPSTITISQVATQQLCVSTCGIGKYYVASRGCVNCEIDCQFCAHTGQCYVCKDGASEVSDGYCDFTSCNDPCETCEGTMSNCTSCISQMFLYQFECVDSCPSGTYETTAEDQNGNQIAVCQILTVPTLYFPACICSIVLIIIVFICNTCIDRDLTDQKRRNINTLTYSSSILAYMELFAVFIMIAFTTASTQIGIAAAGLILWLITNLLFGLYYILVMRKDVGFSMLIDKMSSKSKCVYYTILGFSIAATLRTYRILYCGLFRGVAPYQVRPIKDSKSKGKGAVANQALNNMHSGRTKNAKDDKKKKKNDNKQNQAQDLKDEKQDKNIMQDQNNGETSSAQSGQQSVKFQLKRPYIIYLTLASLIGSILFLIAAAVEIVTYQYLAMLIRGLDLLIVAVISIIVTAIDMWAGIKRSYLLALDRQAQNQTQENLQGLDQDEETHQKILHNARNTQKMNKNSSPKKPPPKKTAASIRKTYSPPRPIRRSKPKQKVLSPAEKAHQQKIQKLKSVRSRYSDMHKKMKKPEEQSSSDENSNEIPDIKIFDDTDLYNNEPINVTGRAKKMKKNDKQISSMNNMRRSNGITMMSSRGNINKTKLNWKLDDIFLGFEDVEGEDNPNRSVEDDKKTVKIHKLKSPKSFHPESSAGNEVSSFEKRQNIQVQDFENSPLEKKQRKAKKQKSSREKSQSDGMNDQDVNIDEIKVFQDDDDLVDSHRKQQQK